MLKFHIEESKLLKDLSKGGLMRATNRVIHQRQVRMAKAMVKSLAFENDVRLTGRWQASWMATLDAAATLSEVPAFTKVPNSIFPDLERQLAGVEGYRTASGPPRAVVVSNPLPYWRFLENESRHRGTIEGVINDVILKARVWGAFSGSSFKGKASITEFFGAVNWATRDTALKDYLEDEWDESDGEISWEFWGEEFKPRTGKAYARPMVVGEAAGQVGKAGTTNFHRYLATLRIIWRFPFGMPAVLANAAMEKMATLFRAKTLASIGRFHTPVISTPFRDGAWNEYTMQVRFERDEHEVTT